MNLSTDQLKALETGQPVPIVIDDKRCIVIREDVYEQAQKALYDDSEWTDDELRAVAAQTVEDADTAGPIE